MKAISLWQPWATLIAHEKKKYETRKYRPERKGPFRVELPS